MMIGLPKPGISAVAVMLLCGAPVFSASAPKLSGSIAGFVRDGSGVPRLGAAVFLFNQSDRLLQRALTNDRGIFGFDSLMPGAYSIRVTLSSFIPALQQKIAVQPGMQSLLYINMASIMSSIELVYAVPGQGALMSDDWKWTLKASSATRPILRALPEISISDPEQRQRPSGNTVFSGTRGVFQVSAGDPGSLGSASESDLGTAFALATSVFGRNQLEVSGNVGYTGHAGLPATAFRSSFSREGFGPEVTVTMRQVYLPTRASTGILGPQDSTPALRTVSISTRDTLQISGNLRLDYGASLDSVTFLEHLSYFSPFARLSYDAGGWGTVQFAYSSGAPPGELLNGPGELGKDAGQAEATAFDASLARDLAALSLLPRISLRDGRAHVQRTQDFELGYEKKLGNSTLNVTGFRETVSNGALTMYAPNDLFAAGDVLPDLSSNSGILNVGSYQRYGYAASMDRVFGDKVKAGVSFGRADALTTDASELISGTTGELRSKIRTSQRYWASARASATLPGTGAQITGSYQWMDSRSIMPSQFYITQRSYPEPGLNIHVRQPIPSLFGMPGRLEATADLQNLLAQGYLPVMTAGQQRLLLIQSPRAVRGGLRFIF